MRQKLTSRKFWMSVASFVTMLLVYLGKDACQAEQIAALIMAGATVIGYVIGEGLADSNPAPLGESIEYLSDDLNEEPSDEV